MIRYDRLNELLLSLTSTEFEELSYILVKSIGFFNLEWMKGGRDKGRDIKAERDAIEPDGYNARETWYFQCKLYSSGIGVSDISTSIDWCIAEKIPYLIILSNSYLTTDAKDFVRKKEEQTGLKIRQWTDKDFQDKLWNRPEILYSYFHGENVVNPNEVFDFKKTVQINIKVQPEIQKQIDEEVTKLGDLNTVEKLIKLLDILDAKSVSNNNDATFRALTYQNFANICYYVGAMDESLKYLNKSLSITPQNKNVLNMKAIVIERMKKYEDSIASCEESLKIDKNDKIALNLMAHNLYQIGQNRKALLYLDDAIKLDNEFILARDNKGKILNNDGKYIEALSCFLDTLTLKPKSKTTWDAMANLFSDLTQDDFALKIVEKIIETDPSFDIIWNTKGHILTKKACSNKIQEEINKFNEEALKCFTKVISLNSFNVLGWSNQGIAFINLGRYDDASKAIEKSINLDSRNILNLNSKAVLLEKKNKDSEALRIIEDALKINKKSILNKRLHYTKAIILAKKNTKQSFKRALDAIQEALSSDKNFIEAYELKGEILEKLNRDKNQIKACHRKIEELQTKYQKISENLLKTLKKSNVFNSFEKN